MTRRASACRAAGASRYHLLAPPGEAASVWQHACLTHKGAEASLQEHLEGCYPDVGHDASAPAACAGRDGAFSAGGTSSVGGTFGGAGAAGIPFEQQL
eukprot:360817-Chlamydomonas_euryale.AAC.6